MSRSKPTLEERDRLDDYVVEWSLKKRSVPQIAAALGVSVSMVSAARGRRRHQLQGKKLYNSKMPSVLPDPPAFDWIAPPPPKIERSYEINSPLPRMQALLDYLRESNALARLPHNVEEAIDAGDAAWYLKFQITGSDLTRLVNEMLQVIENKEAFREALKPSARYDLTRDVVVPNSQEQHLPKKDSGVMPGRIFRDLLGAWWSGIDYTTEEFIQETARKETASPARIRRAVREFAAAIDSMPR